MRRLLVCTFLIWVTLMGGIAIAVDSGQWQRILLSITQLHLADCSIPCWAGFIPGQTSFGEDARHIEVLSGTSELNPSEMVQSRSDFFTFPEVLRMTQQKSLKGF